MKVYVGWDPRDELAFRACVASMKVHSTAALDIYPLKEYDLRRLKMLTREYKVKSNGQFYDCQDEKPFSTQFSFSRFLAPLIHPSDEWILFCDADFLFLEDVNNLLRYTDELKTLHVVKHNHVPNNRTKFDGMIQASYYRKNWSSLMLINQSKYNLGVTSVNTMPGSYLHGLEWLSDERIGELPAKWNWLSGIDDLSIKPSAVHYTNGTPDMVNDHNYAKLWWACVNAYSPKMHHHQISGYSVCV